MSSKSILSYQGPLSFTTIDWLLSEFKRAAQDYDLSFKTYKKMISIMIEALENITKYSEEMNCGEDPDLGLCPSCQINLNSYNIELVTRNPVKNEDVGPLRTRIDNVNIHDREELRELYKSTMSNGHFTEKGGAGLGFIEIAKTAGNKLEYDFEHISKDYSMYTFRVLFSM